ncbi:MAG: hypothetical protein KAR42_14725 [candidate division Zixibacteria bacterium]|nr:hypothetical protein [candidate division Zixibacteria bacterium]
MSKKITTSLIYIHTGGTFEIAVLRGPSMKHARRAILEAITGKRVMINECGINTVYQELYKLFEIDGTCIADMNQKLTEALRNE